MTQKIFPVNNCWECPMLENAVDEDGEVLDDHICGMHDDTPLIVNPNLIPNWCPLEDLK